MSDNNLHATGVQEVSKRRATITEHYRSLLKFATSHETPSSRIAGDVILATYDSEFFKFDFHDMHRLSQENTRLALALLSNHLLTREDASEYLSEQKIDRLKEQRGIQTLSDTLAEAAPEHL